MKMSIIRELRNKDTKSFGEIAFEPSSDALSTFVDLVSVNCKDGGFVDLTQEVPTFNLHIGLRSMYLQSRNIPDIPVRLTLGEDQVPDMHFLEINGYRMTEKHFVDLMGMMVDEEDGINELQNFKQSLVTDVVTTFAQLFPECLADLHTELGTLLKNGAKSDSKAVVALEARIRDFAPKQKFGVVLKKKGGEVHRVLFAPNHPMLASHLDKIEICLDLSHYIDLLNEPKKGKKLMEAQKQKKAELANSKLSAAEIKQIVSEVRVVDPVFDIMLNLHSSQNQNLEVPLGMFTQSNDVIKFSNGTEENYYNDDFYRLGVTMKSVPAFKDLLIGEVVEVLGQLHLHTLNNTVQGLGLEEPWAKDPVAV